MKRLYLFLLISFPIFSISQTQVTIGTGSNSNTTSSYPAPYGNFYWGAKHQMLILASELSAAGMTAGNITSLAFNVDIPASVALTDFTIKLKTTTSTSVTGTFSNTGWTTVYGPQVYTDAGGWNTHTFSTGFAWDGISNLMVETCFANSNWTNNAVMKYTPTSYNSVTYRQQDALTVCNNTSGSFSKNRPDMRFTFTPNGPPTAQFTAHPTNSCNGIVYFTDQSFFGITSWLWDFGDGSTSTSQNPTHTYTASGTYTVSLTATNPNGSNQIVKPAFINVSLGSGPSAPSCSPATTAYCCGFGITNFTFNNINNNSADGSDGYSDFSCTVDTVTTGQNYSISVSTLTPATHNVRVWIDFNNDNSFDPTGELVFSADTSLIATGSVFIPATATLNAALRMRVSADHSLQAIPGPCTSPQFGQVEDYAIYVKPNTNPPVALFKASDTVTCTGTISFTDQSLNVPLSWQWDFGDGSTSTNQNPIHTYTANGTYSVSLTVTNGNGNNTLAKTSYIDVTLGNTPVANSCSPSTFSYCCGYGIYKVQLGTINKSSSNAAEGFKDFSCTDQTILYEGQTYPISIQTNPGTPQDTKAWIDLNNDGVFNATTELVLTSLNSINPSGNINIATGTATLNTPLRMRISSDAAGNNPGPCSALLQGQAEDYTVIVQQPLNAVSQGQENVLVSVYPNPFSEILTIKLSGVRFDNEKTEFSLYDIYGRVVKNFPIHSSEFTITRGTLQKGFYFYSISHGEPTVASGKIVVE